MTDAHCHVSCGDPSVREFLIGRDFVGVHPWDAETADPAAVCATLRAPLAAGTARGIGEIGLDRLHDRAISAKMRAVYEAQLALAFELGCPVVLHGAKCWGQTLAALPSNSPIRFLCHGFSRSGGLIPDIAKLGGFISVGPAVLNDHAVNYRDLVKAIPDTCLLVETDRDRRRGVPSASEEGGVPLEGRGGDTASTGEGGAPLDGRGEDTASTVGPSIREILEKTAELRGVTVAALEALTDANATRFLTGVSA